MVRMMNLSPLLVAILAMTMGLSPGALTAGAERVPILKPPTVLVAGEIHWAADFAAPPNQFYDPQGRMTGLNPEMCDAIAKKLAVRSRWTNLAFPGLIPGLQAGRFDSLCTSVFITPARKEIMNMIAYVQWGHAILVPRGNPKQIRSLTDLSNVTVAVAAAGTTFQHLQETNTVLTEQGKPLIRIRAFDSNAEAFQALANNQADAAYFNDPQAYFYMKLVAPNRFEVAMEKYRLTPLAITTKKDNLDLALAIQWALRQLRNEGTYQQIAQKWGVTPYQTILINP
jgi:polar amino acid transport system substrate-binding protein